MTANPSSSANPLGLQTAMAPPTPGRFKPLDPLRVLRQHMWLLLASAVVGVVAGSVLFYVLRREMPEYTSRAQLVVTAPASLTGGGSQTADAEEAATFIQNQLPVLMSPEVLGQAVGTPRVLETEFYQRAGDPPAAVRALQNGALTVSGARGSTLINLAVSTREQKDAELILRSIIQFYLKRVEETSTTGASGRREVFQRQIGTIEDDISGARNRLTVLVDSPDLISIRQNEAQVDYDRLVRLRAERVDQLRRARNMLQMRQEMAATGEERPLTPEEREQLERRVELGGIKSDLLRLRQLRELYLEQFPPGHREVKAVERRIAAAQTTKEAEIQRLAQISRDAEIPAIQSAVASLETDVAETEAQLRAATQRQIDLQQKLVEYRDLQSDVERLERQRSYYEGLLEREVVQGEMPNALRVYRQTGPTPADLTFPTFTVIVPGVTLLVLGLATGLVFMWELLDQRVKSTADVRMLPDAELLGMLPDAGEDPSGATPVERVVERHPTGLMAEGYRRVRTAVLGKMDRRGYRTLVVVGTGPGAGASSVAHNLATSMALNGRRVLLLDANFRRPAQGELLDIRCEGGLVPLLRGEATLEDSVRPVEGLTLWVLPAGSCHGAMPEMLEGAGFRELLAELESRFDLIVLDCPPALLTTDAQLLAKHVDAILVVVRAGRDKRGMVERTLRQLDGQRADVLGVVLNGVRSARGGYFRRSYREYYRYHEPMAERRLKNAAASNGNGSGNGNGRGAGGRGGAAIVAEVDADDEPVAERL